MKAVDVSVPAKNRSYYRMWIQARISKIIDKDWEVFMYRVVQLIFTPEIEVFYMLFERRHTENRMRSIKQHIKYFNSRSKVQLDHPVDTYHSPSQVGFSIHQAEWRIRWFFGRYLCIEALNVIPVLVRYVGVHRIREGGRDVLHGQGAAALKCWRISWQFLYSAIHPLSRNVLLPLSLKVARVCLGSL